MKKIAFLIINLMLLKPGVSEAYIGPGHVVGEITNITSIQQGLLVRIGSNIVPENCTSGRVWMLVKQEYTAMTSMLLASWTLGKNITVYTNPTTISYCEVIQIDPVG